VAEAEKLTSAPLGPVASTVMLFGSVRMGPLGQHIDEETAFGRVLEVIGRRCSHQLASSGNAEPEAGEQSLQHLIDSIHTPLQK
jgi:hypothetical protein